MSGLFRGLGSSGYNFHPDEAKQVLALLNFLNDTYVCYYGDVFYDGYPYGLNHLDEYILRPLLQFLGLQHVPGQYYLFYYARILRVLYGMLILVIGYKLVDMLLQNKKYALFAMFIIAISPVSITVTHFATGDIGVDLFSTLCMLFLFFYIHKKYSFLWLFVCGIAVGAGFSAKYNGALIAILPTTVLFFQFLQHRRIILFMQKCTILAIGCIAGIVIFTPNIFLDFETTLVNIYANFVFIKNYNVPEEILMKPWLEKATLGLKNNSIYILSSLGYTLCIASIIGFLITTKEYVTSIRLNHLPQYSTSVALIAISFFFIGAMFLSLTGKLMVQPFHFSYLQLPIIILSCYMLSIFFSSKRKSLTIAASIFVVLIVFEFSRISLQENFFWRLEDNQLYKDYLPASIYSKDALKISQQGVIRSLYLETAKTSVFRNLDQNIKGPDASLWNTIQVAPLPQIPNPIGADWIFCNGPTFPKNERIISLHAGHREKTIKRYLVIPKGKAFPTLGFRSGSYATDATVNFGDSHTVVKLEAHQQKTISLTPKYWKTSVSPHQNKTVSIVPLEISIPHDDIWITILTSQKESTYFSLFGGGQNNTATPPQEIPTELGIQYLNAIKNLKYMEYSPFHAVVNGVGTPVMEILLPAGHYKLTCEIEGITDESSVTLEIRDAKGKGITTRRQQFLLNKGKQKVEYLFSKAFVPYQGHLIVQGITGESIIHSIKLTPNYQKLTDDFKLWRSSGRKPEWVSRNPK